MGASMRPRVRVLHGVNLDRLGERDPDHYGSLSLVELEQKIQQWADELELDVSFFQSNHEGEYIEELHRLAAGAEGALLNPGAWVHYSYALRDAAEDARAELVEVHLSDVANREQWRQSSVLEGLVVDTISGRGAEGYQEALQRLRDRFDELEIDKPAEVPREEPE